MLMLDNFHFLRPIALLLIPLSILIIWVWMRIKLASSQWQSILPSHLHQRLITSKGDSHSKQPFLWLMVALTLSSLAAAGPTWEKLPQPVYQTNSGRVVVMDMSLSMRSTDVSPTRLARAKFKAIDLITEINDGEVGLVAYAGDAFTISPLTEDIGNLQNLIPSLSPEIMPNSGSNPVSGLQQAMLLLDNAGYQNGHIYWITDGIELDDIKALRDLINNTQYEFSALTIGTDEGAPIQLVDGSLLKDNRGAIVIPQVNMNYLNQALAPSNARQTRMSIDDSDIRSMLLTSNRLDQVRDGQQENSTGDAWRDMGIYAVLLVLPIALLMFRRGVLFSLVLIVMLPNFGQIVWAQDLARETDGSSVHAENQLLSAAQSLFMNRDQKGKQAFEQQDYESATTLFDDINWRAAAAYKAGDYQAAEALYQQTDGLESIYNRGNALAQLGQLQNAIEAYDKVLRLDPEHQDAARNKAIVEALLEQQEQKDEESGDQNQPPQQPQDGSEGKPDKDSKGEQSESQNGDETDDKSGGDNAEESDEQSSEQDPGQGEQANQDPQQSDPQSGSPQADQKQAPSDAQAQVEDGQSDQPPPASNQVDRPLEQAQADEQRQSVQAVEQSEMTPEEREQMQRLQTLMNKIPDDPSYLLKRKMLIEAQRRQQYAPPTNKEQEW
jgi:Ca-activated chloride channel family protein